jgi:steroid 5-alpha reductase family enzyme
LASGAAVPCCTTIAQGKITSEGWKNAVKAKKILLIVGVALLAFFLISQPVQSAQLVNEILLGLKNAAEAVITFVRSVFNG